MKIKNYKILLIIIFFSLIGPANAENTFFTDGKNYFNSENYKKAKFIKITKAGFYESMVHSVEMTKEEVNYKL